ncbi:MAG TPA: ATP-binding protein [Sulfurospirillum arcachonense]|nr:ATP-binding protein [Sulfurospirillum arcachonense]HIP43892.1 ATP-binding protein [Sulfurospirillum arcachonense]
MKKINRPFKDFMGSIDNMTIARKTSLLFLIMVVGMLFIGSFAHMSLNRIKGDFDILYDKRMVPVIRLEKIKDIYTVNILDTLRDIESSHISVNDGESIILLAQELIRRDWSEYKTSLSINETDWMVDMAQSVRLINLENKKKTKSLEDDMIHSIEQKIRKIDTILVDIFNMFGRNHTGDAFVRLQDDLYPSVNSINIHLTQLISLNLEVASSGKQRTEAVYENTFEWIVAATIGTIAIAALLATVILQNIRLLHGQLARMVDAKTKELQDLNSALEDKIALEVEQSRQKDQIMFRQSRLAAMGEMVGNIAHQWRQPLNAIVLIIQSFQMKQMLGKLDDKFIDSQVDEGIKLATSMSRTIDDFRNFFKPNKIEENFSAKRTIQESIDLVQHYYEKQDIKMNLICEEDFETLGYPNEFSQVMMNLFSNSKDVLQDRENQERNIEIIVKLESESKRGEILVIDNGGGVPVEVIDRMFDPYFTTKHQSSGTGIGLYMSKEIIEKQMHGSIEVENISHKFFEDKEVYEKCACIKILMPINEKEKG